MQPNSSADRAMPWTVAPATGPGVPPARVFVGIRVAPEIAHQLAELAASLQTPSVRLVPPADIHLTLVPPWNEASIPDAIAKLSHLTSGFREFWLEFEHVCYGPQQRRRVSCGRSAPER
jgi:2'-5' RNA ligase